MPAKTRSRTKTVRVSARRALRLAAESDLLAQLRSGRPVPAAVLDQELPGWRAAAARLEARGRVKVRMEGVSRIEHVSLSR